MPGSKPLVHFSIEDIATAPAPGMAIPNSFAFSHDDARLAYLLGSGQPPIQQLYALDVATGAASVQVSPPGGGAREENISPEEELRRQRARMLAVGLTGFSLTETSDRILVPLLGSIYVQDGPTAPLRQVFDCGDGPPALTPTLAPNGMEIAFVRDAEIELVAASGGKPRRLTRGARRTGKTHGLAEYIAQEELGRSEGFWWSPDSRLIAFTEVDETHIPVYRIMHQGKDITGPAAQEDHHYPFAGAANAHVRLGVIPSFGGMPVWMDLDGAGEIYIAHVFWWPGGSLGAVLLSRDQTAVEIARFEMGAIMRKTVLRETTNVWINLTHKPIFPLKDDSFLWLSERSGFRHIEHCDRDGKTIRRLTEGAWMVDALKAVDEADNIVYFTSTRDGPTEAHLYAVPLAGGRVRRITSEPGMHDVTLDHACRRFVDVHSALDRAPTVTLRALADGKLVHTVPFPEDPRVKRFKLTPPEIVTLRNRDGVELYGMLYRPPAFYGPGPYPTIVQVYGGPHAQTVTNSWAKTVALQLQYLRSLGYLIFLLDNRGSARRGVEFERSLRHRMGTSEVDDQVDGVRWLVAQGLADAKRVGVTGWSYGGYMTLLCLAKAPDTFAMGVAGAPVTHYDGYDTAYTERYMGTPQTNPDGYDDGSVLAHVANMRGKLLLVHGMLDENVHFRHTARLINALTRARKRYDLIIFPDERHMPRHPADRVYLQERIIEYFQENL